MISINVSVPQQTKAFLEASVDKAKMIAYDSAPQALKKGAVTYATTASRNMPPPNRGSRKADIDEKLYWRKIYNLGSMIKKARSDSKLKKRLVEFIAMYNKGMRFVVFGYKDRGKHQTRWYAETRYLAKSRVGRIQYRGLYKWLFGANLDKIGEKTPNIFKKLLTKSPKLINKKNLSKMKFIKNEDSIAIESEYTAQGIDYFVDKSKEKALKSSLNRMKKLLQKKVDVELKKEFK